MGTAKAYWFRVFSHSATAYSISEKFKYDLPENVKRRAVTAGNIHGVLININRYLCGNVSHFQQVKLFLFELLSLIFYLGRVLRFFVIKQDWRSATYVLHSFSN